MNDIELDKLNAPINNLAKLLYCLILRPQANLNQGTAEVNNKSIMRYLNASETVIRFGKDINRLLQELHQHGLIEFEHDVDFSATLHKRQLTLPFVKESQNIEDPNLHGHYFSLTVKWRPIESVFKDLASLIGLIDQVYNADELGEFIAYWMGRNDACYTEYQWTQKFVVHLKNRRMKTPLSKSSISEGHQYSHPEAGLMFDENVKNLVNKYKQEM